MIWKSISEEYDAPLADLIRHSLKANRLDLPGTVYFDEGLDHLTKVYGTENGRCAYYILLQEDGTFAGGIGFAEFAPLGNCCELQKLYLSETLHGQGMAYRMISFIEDRAREHGFAKIYLETHTNLQAAIHIYEKAGYHEIDRPEGVVHSTMNRFYLKDLKPQESPAAV